MVTQVERSEADRLFLAPNTDRSLALSSMLNGLDPNYVDGPWCDRGAFEEWAADREKAEKARHAAELAEARKSGGSNGAKWHPSPAECEVSPKGFIRVKWCDRVRLGLYVKPDTLLYVLSQADAIRDFVETNRGVWEPRQKAYAASKKPA